jgi:hypothetical protein
VTFEWGYVWRRITMTTKQLRVEDLVRAVMTPTLEAEAVALQWVLDAKKQADELHLIPEPENLTAVEESVAAALLFRLAVRWDAWTPEWIDHCVIQLEPVWVSGSGFRYPQAGWVGTPWNVRFPGGFLAV